MKSRHIPKRFEFTVDEVVSFLYCRNAHFRKTPRVRLYWYLQCDKRWRARRRRDAHVEILFKVRDRLRDAIDPYDLERIEGLVKAYETINRHKEKERNVRSWSKAMFRKFLIDLGRDLKSIEVTFNRKWTKIGA